MLETYEATLYGNRLEWHGQPPDKSATRQPVVVQVTIASEPIPSPDQTSGNKMADILEQLAGLGRRTVQM